VVFLSGITFAFIEAPTLGWTSPAVLAMALLGAAGLGAFLIRESRVAAPMLPLSIFRERQFAAASAVTFIVYAALTGATFLFPLVLQIVSGYSPLASGLAVVPLTAIMLALSARSGQLADRIGPRLQLSAGPLRARCATANHQRQPGDWPVAGRANARTADRSHSSRARWTSAGSPSARQITARALRISSASARSQAPARP
jgi:hypothetical protein